MNRRHRRDFLKGAVASLGLAGTVAAGDDSPRPRQHNEAAAEALTAAARARFGKHLSETQAKSVRTSIMRGLQAAEAMKRVQLQNSDEPDFVFFAD